MLGCCNVLQHKIFPRMRRSAKIFRFDILQNTNLSYTFENLFGVMDVTAFFNGNPSAAVIKNQERTNTFYSNLPCGSEIINKTGTPKVRTLF